MLTNTRLKTLYLLSTRLNNQLRESTCFANSSTSTTMKCSALNGWIFIVRVNTWLYNIWVNAYRIGFSWIQCQTKLQINQVINYYYISLKRRLVHNRNYFTKAMHVLVVIKRHFFIPLSTAFSWPAFKDL